MTKSTGPGIAGIQDNFYKKAFLIGKANSLRVVMGDKVFPQVLMIKDGWMEYTAGANIDDFQNANQLQDKNHFRKGLTVLNEYLKSQGITLLIVVAPNKASIYPEKIPEQIQSLPGPTRLDNFTTYMTDNNLPVLDLRPAFKAARQNQDLYYQTDSHWNGYGAFVAYTSIMDALGNSYPELKPYKAEDLELVNIGPDVRDISRMLEINFTKEFDTFYKPKEPFVQKIVPGYYLGYTQSSWIVGSDLPKLLMFHDSFGANYLNDYLSMNFSQSDFIYIARMPDYISRESIQRFKPDVVIIEIVERNLYQLPDFFSGFMLE